MRVESFRPLFVRTMPAELEDGVMYVSMEFRMAQHRCACGCGMIVVTPFGPAQWQLAYDGSVSLHPSIGNWNFACRSHYVVRRGQVKWARSFSEEEVAVVKRHDRKSLEELYGVGGELVAPGGASEPERRGWLGRLCRVLVGRKR